MTREEISKDGLIGFCEPTKIFNDKDSGFTCALVMWTSKEYLEYKFVGRTCMPYLSTYDYCYAFYFFTYDLSNQ